MIEILTRASFRFGLDLAFFPFILKKNFVSKSSAKAKKADLSFLSTVHYVTLEVVLITKLAMLADIYSYLHVIYRHLIQKYTADV